MRRHYRRRRFYATFQFWFLLLGISASVAAWRLGYIPVEFGGVETGTLGTPESIETESISDDVPDVAPMIIRDTDDSLAFSDQEEPPTVTTDSEPWAVAAQNTLTPHSTPDPDNGIAPLLPSDRLAPRHEGSSVIPATNQGNAHHATANSDQTMRVSPNATAVAQPILQVSGAEGETSAATDVVESSTLNDATPTTYEARTASRASSTVNASPTPTLDLQELDRLIESGKDVEVHREMSTLYWNQPELRPLIDERIREMARRIYFSPQPHYMPPHVIQPGDQLRKIASKYNVTWQYMSSLNRVDPRRIQAGQKLKVIKGPFSAVVDLSDFELTVHAHGYFVRKYGVGVGKDNSSPIGKFTVLNKVIDPQYTDPEGNVIAGDDPTNPLGDYWLDIGDGFGIHGTIYPDSIGRAESRGCIRMLNEEVAEVYNMLTTGSEVIIQR